jgi:hypothetical protein
LEFTQAFCNVIERLRMMSKYAWSW